MVSYKNTKDSFGGLLSEVSSIDSSLFEKKSLKEAQKSQIEKKAAQGTSNVSTSSPSMQTPTFATQFNPQNRTTPSASSPGMSMQKPASRTAIPASAASLNTRASDQFDALIGDFSNSRQNRPMRPPVKYSGVANSTIMGTQSASNSGVDHAGSGHDNLDDFLSTSQTQAPLPVDSILGSGSHFLEGFGQSHAPHVSVAEADPFDIFQSPPKQEPSPMQRESEDLLGGFEGSLGVEDHRAPADPVILTEPAAVMLEQNGQEDDLDIFAPTPVPSKEARSPLQQNGLPQASTGRVTYSPDRQTPRLNNAKDEDEELRELQEHRKPESTGKHVPTSHPHGDASSARRERPTSARRREPASSQLSPGKEKTETASKWQSKDEGSSSWQAAGPGGKDSAKEWLDKGQKWLFTAGKKVAAAAKEASSTIQSKLDEMEVFKSQSKGPRTWSPDDDDMIPEYYKEWAATIERLGPEEQARTLGQMTEDDRLVVQRIMDQSSVRRSTATRVSPTTSRPQQISGSENGARRAAPPRPPQRTHSAEALSQPSPPSRAASSGSVERPRRSASYNLGTAPSADESLDARPSGSAPATPERPAPAGTPSKPPVHSSPSPQKARPPPTVHKQADLLGLFGGEAQPEDDFMGAPSPQPAASSRGNSAADLFDMGDESSSRAPQSSAAQGQEEVDILGMFASAAPAASAEDGKPHERGAAATAAASKPAASGLDELFGAHKADASMIDFGDEEVSEASAASAVRFTAAGDIDVEGEPEMRRQARAKRLAEKQAQIRAALAEKQARDSAEAQEKERKVELREEYKQRMKAWQQGKDGNIRALLSSLDTVLWENSGWKKPAMTDLLEPQRVKRAYMKANLVVHPDKVKQKGGTVEQIVIADIAFDALKGAWAKFEAAELR